MDKDTNYNKSLIKSFGYAFEGLFHAIKFNRNFKIHLVVALMVILLSIFFNVRSYEMGILGVMILLVILAEMINTAIEEMVNLITNEHRREAKIAKDVAAGMVLVTAMGAVVVGIFIFTPYILKLF
ncbi:MAG: diacylglycerol kinase family protein [Candidatus Levybacteria bacterium]|nr:diacylglycerol kinase family protein [Candidatus Levybacteria bacterium]